MNVIQRIALLSLSVCFVSLISAQNSKQRKKPVFYEIDAEMLNYVADSLRYPADAPPQGLPSSIVVRFTINTKGEVENPLLVRGGHPSCDAEALRLVKAMPKRKPQKAPTNYMLPIRFYAQQKKQEPEVSIPSSCTDQEAEECSTSSDDEDREDDLNPEF